MRIYVDKVTGVAQVTHANLAAKFNMRLYRDVKTFKEKATANDPFITVNKYLETLPDNIQQQLFDLYTNCKQDLDDLTNIEEINSKLVSHIAEMSQIMTVADIRSWYVYKSGIPTPVDLKDSLSELEDPYLATEAQTYLRRDYIGLCALSVAMTFLSPIFSHYVEKTKNIYGTEWKTYYAYFLLKDSTYYTSEEHQKLNEYVLATIESLSPRYDSLILKGMSKEEYPVWMMSVIIIRKVATGDVSGDPLTPSLVKFIYRYILQRIGTMETDFYGVIKPRKPLTSANSTENNTPSQFELYAPRQSVADHIVVLNEVYLENIKAVAQKLDPSIPDELIAESAESSKMLYEGDIEDGQIILLKWVLSYVISPRIIDYLGRESVVNGIIAARAYLWHSQFYDIAGLISALPIDNGDDHMLTGTDKRVRVSKELQEVIDEKYPYYPKSQGNKKTKPQRAVHVSVDKVEEELSKHEWYLTLPNSWLKTGNLGVTTRHYTLNDNIRVSLVELALKIAERKPLSSPF